MPGDGASIGEVYVDILPNADNFWAKVQTQIGPQADRVGKDIGKTIADQIAKGIRDGLGDGFKGQPGREPGRRTAEEFAGEFDRTVRTRLQAALKALPKAEIGASATEAEQKIRDLRASLAELSTKRIGIDVDEATALAEVRRLQEELARLARETPSVRVTADAARAAAELEAIGAQAEKIARINPNVHIDTNAAEAAAEVETVKAAADRSTGSMGALLFAGIALGPAIVPAAAAAAAAVAAIGLGALGVVGGLGVVLLGTRGVSDAVKAMSAAQTSAAASAVQLAQRQQQVAGAADSVRSAEASLANARANASDATRRSAETLANAQVSVTQAEQAALRAEQDLTRARESARRANEDLAQQVKDGALAQRQAVLDLEKAEQNLTAVRANPAATKLQREEAQLNYEQAKQQIEDLGIRQQRLVTDNTAAQKAGVDGSQQVVAAQDRITQSQDALRRAVQALGDARVAEANTARQNAFAVAQATQGVVSAQRSLEQATVSAGGAGSTAMDKLRTSTAALTPEGQRFATLLFSLGGYWTQLRSVAQDGLLPGAREGLVGLLPLMPQAITLVGDLSRESGHLASEAGRAFGAPYWQQFFTFLDGQAVPALDVFGHSVGFTVIGVSALVRAFAPLGQDVGQGLLRFTRDFATHALTVQNTAGYREFITFVRTEGPQVVTTIGDLASAIIHVSDAVGPIGGTTLTIIRLLAQTINALPTPVLTVVAGSIIAVTVATKAYGLAQAGLAAAQPAFAAAQLVYNQAVVGATTAMANSSGAFGGFGTALAGIRGGAQGAVSAVGTLASNIGPGGALAIGLTAAAIGVTFFANEMATSRARTQQLTGALSQLVEAYKQTSSLSSQSARDVIKQNNDLASLVVNTDRYGLSLRDIVDAGQGAPGTLDRIDAAQRKLRDSQGGLTSEQGRAFNALRALYDQAQRNADIDKILGTGQDAAAGSTRGMTNAQIALHDALVKVGDQSATAADKADALRRAQDAIFGAAQAADQAQEALAAAHDQLNEAVQRSTDAHDKNAHSLDIHTAAGRANRDALRQQLSAINDEYFANIRNGESVEEATKKHDDETKTLEAQSRQLSLSSGDVQKLIDTYGRVPTDVKTQITVSGVEAALTQLQQLEIAQLALQQGIPVDQATKEYKAQHKIAQGLGQGLATGGPVVGPGGPTDDMVPAIGPGGAKYRLSNDEHVWTAAEVQAAGGHGAVMEIRKAVLGGRSPHVPYPGDGSGGIAFAQGGAVQWPFPVNISHLWEPTIAQLQQRYQYGVGWSGPVSGDVAAAQAWLRGQAGKPYGWDEAGPGSYDCSGIVSAVYNIMHGQSPYRHTFSTGNEANYFTKPGWGPLTAGWTNPGEAGPGGNSVGHTAGVLAGLPFESRGSVGVVVGAGVTPVTAFAHIGHYDSGGVLPPGLTIARNDTGQNEWVMTDNQIGHIAQAAAGRAGGPRNLLNIEQFNARDNDPHAVANELDWILRTRGG